MSIVLKFFLIKKYNLNLSGLKMNKIIILLAIIGISSLSASVINIKTIDKEEIVNLLIKDEVFIKREVPQTRIARASRDIRQSRIAHLGRNSRGVRAKRDSRIIYKNQEKKVATISATALIKKNYLSKLSK